MQEVPEPKPPPWPQEGFRGEAPTREPLLPDSQARMELTGKEHLRALGPNQNLVKEERQRRGAARWAEEEGLESILQVTGIMNI